MTRIRSAVDIAYSLDPRIVMFKTQDSEEKLAKKMEKKKAVREKQEQEEQVMTRFHTMCMCLFCMMLNIERNFTAIVVTTR